MNESKTFYLAVAATFVLGHASCSAEHIVEPSRAEPAAVQGAETTPEPPETSARVHPFHDAQIVQITQAIDRGEVAQGRVATARARDPRVQAFAQRTIRQHTDSAQRSAQWSAKSGTTPVSCTVSTQFERRAIRMVHTLEDMDPGLFDAMYMDAQVEQYRRVLDMLDLQLIPDASNPALRGQLQLNRDMIANHLADAIELQDNLGR